MFPPRHAGGVVQTLLTSLVAILLSIVFYCRYGRRRRLEDWRGTDHVNAISSP